MSKSANDKPKSPEQEVKKSWKPAVLKTAKSKVKKSTKNIKGAAAVSPPTTLPEPSYASISVKTKPISSTSLCGGKEGRKWWRLVLLAVFILLGTSLAIYFLTAGSVVTITSSERRRPLSSREQRRPQPYLPRQEYTTWRNQWRPGGQEVQLGSRPDSQSGTVCL